MPEKYIRILITGINGFIGKNLVQGLVKDGIEFIGVSMEEACSIRDVNFYEQADISDYEKMENVFEKYKPDYVVHLAAIVHKKSMTADYGTFYKINYLSSENIFSLCERYNVKKVLFSSTVEVYKMQSAQSLNEASETNPNSDYGKTKLLAEKALIAIASNNEFNYAIMRFAPVYGADFKLNLERRIYLIRNKLLYYFGEGSYFYNMCSISNIVDFISEFIRGNHPSGIYNISDSKNYTIKELASMEKESLKKNSILAFSIRLPYHLTFITIAFIEGIFKILKRKSIFSVYNFKKIFKCTIFDNKKADDVVGGLRWDFRSTLYGKGEKH